MKLKSIHIKLATLLLVVNFLFAPMAQAGVVKQMVQVNKEEQAKLEKERAALQEQYEAEAEQAKAAEAETQRRMDLAQRIREQAIDEANADYVAQNGSSTSKVYQKSSNNYRCKNTFFCTIIKILTLPFAAIYHVFHE